jgi:4-hydroxybenzoate polyprenyltransferase
MFNITVNFGANNILALGFTLLVLVFQLVIMITKKSNISVFVVTIVLGTIAIFLGYMINSTILINDVGLPIVVTGFLFRIEELVKQKPENKKQLRSWIGWLSLVSVALLVVGTFLMVK